ATSHVCPARTSRRTENSGPENGRSEVSSGPLAARSICARAGRGIATTVVQPFPKTFGGPVGWITALVVRSEAGPSPPPPSRYTPDARAAGGGGEGEPGGAGGPEAHGGVRDGARGRGPPS